MVSRASDHQALYVGSTSAALHARLAAHQLAGRRGQTYSLASWIRENSGEALEIVELERFETPPGALAYRTRRAAIEAEYRTIVDLRRVGVPLINQFPVVNARAAA